MFPYQVRWKSLIDVQFFYTYKTALFAENPIGVIGPYNINGTIDYVKYPVTLTQNQISLNGRTISTNPLYKSNPMAD